MHPIEWLSYSFIYSTAFGHGFLLPRTDTSPTVTISANPSTVLNIESSVILTCEATFDSQVDELLSVAFSWGGPRVISGDRYSTTEPEIGLRYTSNLMISDVEREDGGEYTCTVRVSRGGGVLGTITGSILVTVLGKGSNKGITSCISYYH